MPRSGARIVGGMLELGRQETVAQFVSGAEATNTSYVGA